MSYSEDNSDIKLAIDKAFNNKDITDSEYNDMMSLINNIEELGEKENTKHV